MKRRDFIKSGLVSLGSVGGIPLRGMSQPLADSVAGEYAEGKKLTLSNQSLAWDFLFAGGTVTSVGLRNKLSGKYFALDNAKELSLTFSEAAARVEIPWWYVKLGADNDTSSPEQEEGFRMGYHRSDFSGEQQWDTTLNLLMRGASSATGPLVFQGYAWFRQSFELPARANGQPIVFCLGGYNQEDWNEYSIFVNGSPIGNWKRSGRWRSPEEWVVRPGTKEYAALKFGQGKNLLAVRGFQTDKRFGGLREEILERYIFEGRLCDQFVTVGEPYRKVSDFQLRHWYRQGEGERQTYTFELVNAQEQLHVTLHYELDGPLRRKWAEIKNVGSRERLLLDIDVDQFNIAAPASDGDFGYPILVADEIFCALEHPAGLNQAEGGKVLLRHFPGKKLAPGASIVSKVALVGVAPQAGVRRQFVSYLQTHSPRKKMLAIYDPLGINGFPDDPCWTLDDEEMLESADMLEKWQRQGVKFDYYVPDVGWQDSTGDITRFWPHCFPEGPGKVIRRVNALGMKWGLWFTGTWADWTSGLNPKTVASRTVVAGGKWPEYKFRDNYDLYNGDRQLCLASEPYFSMLRDALLTHIRTNNLKLFKLDASSYFCNNPEHGHLPGKYSTEANFDAVIEIARATRQAVPDLYIMWYWGIRSPFFALYGDSIFEKRIRMEAASTGDAPALFFRDAVTLALDQAGQFNDLIPPMNKDSLGVWITDTWWGNAMRKERWREAIIMDLGRGNLLFPQLWGELRLFNDQDIAFLARIQRIAKENEPVFYTQHVILGDPWDKEVYGYAYFQGAHGFLFMNNVDFQSRKVTLPLDERIGLNAPAGARLRVVSHFPEETTLKIAGSETLVSGGTIESWLRPFEVAMWEILPVDAGSGAAAPASLRELAAQQPEIVSQRLPLKTLAAETAGESMPGFSGAEIHYGDPLPEFRSSVKRPTLDEFASMGYRKQILVRGATLPAYDAAPQVLAIVLRFQKDGRPWRCRQPADLVQAKATIGGQPILRFETVPNFRQTENNESCPWLVFKIRTNPLWSGQEMAMAINAYLPPQVEVVIEGWLVPLWWTPSPAM